MLVWPLRPLILLPAPRWVCWLTELMSCKLHFLVTDFSLELCPMWFHYLIAVQHIHGFNMHSMILRLRAPHHKDMEQGYVYRVRGQHKVEIKGKRVTYEDSIVHKGGFWKFTTLTIHCASAWFKLKRPTWMQRYFPWATFSPRLFKRTYISHLLLGQFFVNVAEKMFEM